MSTRPAPRKSSLAGSSPVAPPAQPAQPATPEPDVVPAAAQPAAPKPARAASSTSDKTKYRHKVSFYQHPDDTARVRGAILHTQVTEGARTLSQFVNDAVLAEVERLEAKYNNGQPFPAVGARELPQGRPMGE